MSFYSVVVLFGTLRLYKPRFFTGKMIQHESMGTLEVARRRLKALVSSSRYFLRD